MKDYLMCMALGFIAGAIVVSSNNKAMAVVEKGKKVVKDGIKKMSD